MDLADQPADRSRRHDERSRRARRSPSRVAQAIAQAVTHPVSTGHLPIGPVNTARFEGLLKACNQVDEQASQNFGSPPSAAALCNAVIN